MSITITDCMLTEVPLDEGGYVFAIRLDNTQEDGPLEETMSGWTSEDELQVLELQFSIAEIVGSVIDGYSQTREAPHTLDNEARPVLEFIKAEMLKAIDLIDECKYNDSRLKLP